MPKRPLNDVQDPILREHLKNLQEDWIENPLTLTSVPDSTTPLLQANETGIDTSDDYWIRIGNKLLKITPTQVIDL